MEESVEMEERVSLLRYSHSMGWEGGSSALMSCEREGLEGWVGDRD